MNTTKSRKTLNKVNQIKITSQDCIFLPVSVIKETNKKSLTCHKKQLTWLISFKMFDVKQRLFDHNIRL